MEMQTAILIFIVIFALAIGFFLGLFLISLDAPFLKRLFQQEEDEESPGHAETEAASPGEEGAIEVGKPSLESELVLKVWREEGKPPVYEVDGNYLEKDALPKELLDIITIHEDSPQEPKAAPQPAVEQTTPEPVQEKEDGDEGEVKMLSVVDEVNEIIQRKLHGSPLAGKGIHLMENFNKEIRFWVGLESYDDVEDIPDPEVRELIDAAVKEWEQSRE